MPEMMMTKTDEVRSLVKQKDFKKALRLAKGFRIGVSRLQAQLMSLAYECIVHPEFYQALGIDTEAVIEEGKQVVLDIFSQ